MARGSKVVPVRIPDDLLIRIIAATDSQTYHTKGGQSTISSWIKQACKEKLAHLLRSKGSKKSTKIWECEKCGALVSDGDVAEFTGPDGTLSYSCIPCLGGSIVI